MKDSGLFENKHRLRAAIRQQLQHMDVAERQTFSAAICRAIIDHAAYREARVIFCYAAMENEADPAQMIRHALAHGKRVVYPVCKADGVMDAWEPMDKAAWRVGKHGIWEPDAARAVKVLPEEPDLSIVPGLAFDECGGRLGHGAGYYDRYFAFAPHTYRLGICFECQMVQKLPTEQHDVSMNGIVTETQNRSFET